MSARSITAEHVNIEYPLSNESKEQNTLQVDNSLHSSASSSKSLAERNNEDTLDPTTDVVDTEKHAQDEPPKEQIDVPDGGYGWFVVAAIFLFNFCTWGANSGFAVYLAHYLSSNRFENASKYDYSLIGGFSIGLGLMFAAIINYLVGLTEARIIMMVGNCFQLAAVILASFATELWQLYLTQGVLISFGLAFIFMPGLPLLPQWFRKKRTLTQGIAAGGSGAGGVMFNLAMEKIMDVKSVAWALRTQDIICFVLTCVGIALTRTRTKTIKAEFNLFDKLVFQCFGYWIQILYLIFTMFGYVVLLYNLADFTASLGYSQHQASVVSSMVSVGALVGRPTVGYLSDKYGVIKVSIFAHFFVSVFCFAMWIPDRNYATSIAFALIAGTMMGSVWPTVSSITARIVGLRKLGVAFGMQWVFLGAACIAAPVIGISLKKGTSSDQYLDVSIFVGFSYFGATLCLVILRGWIIARDLLAEVGSESDLGQELYLTIPIMDGFKRMFTLRPVKKT